MAGRMVKELDYIIPEETERKHFCLFILEQMLKGNLIAAFCFLRVAIQKAVRCFSGMLREKMKDISNESEYAKFCSISGQVHISPKECTMSIFIDPLKQIRLCAKQSDQSLKLILLGQELGFRGVLQSSLSSYSDFPFCLEGKSYY